jgi:hypothetical protein
LGQEALFEVTPIGYNQTVEIVEHLLSNSSIVFIGLGQLEFDGIPSQ